MTLGNLIKFLERQNQEKVLPMAFKETYSYRGYYSELAFVIEKNVKCSDMLSEAKSAVGAMYTGYKGGDFVMSEHTDCYIVDDPSRTGDELSLILMRYMFNDWEPFEES